MHIRQLWAESEELPENLSVDAVQNAVIQEVEEWLSARVTRCEVYIQPVFHTKTSGESVYEERRCCRISFFYGKEARSLEDTFEDIDRINAVASFSFGGGGHSIGIGAIIPEIHPLRRVGVRRSWSYTDGYEAEKGHRPPDSTRVSVELLGLLQSEEARRAFNAAADIVNEPHLQSDGLYETKTSWGSIKNAVTPEIEFVKRWKMFDTNAAEEFVRCIAELGRQYRIFDPEVFKNRGWEHEGSSWPLNTITAQSWTDTKDESGHYWRMFQVEYHLSDDEIIALP